MNLNLALTADERDQIYRKVLSIRLFEMPEPSPPTLPRIINIFSDSFIIRLKVKDGDVVKNFEWYCGNTPAPDAEVQWRGMGELLGLIYGIVTSRPEYEEFIRRNCRI